MLSHTVWLLQSLQAFFCSFDSSLPCLESIIEDKTTKADGQLSQPHLEDFQLSPRKKKVNLGGPDVSLA